MAGSKISGVELVCLASGKYRLTVDDVVVADEVEFSEAVKKLEQDANEGGSDADN